MRWKHACWLATVSVSLVGTVCAAQEGAAPAAVVAPAGTVARPEVGGKVAVIGEFRGRGFEVAYLAFAKKVQIGPEFVTLGGKETTDQGGALVNGEIDLQKFVGATPYIVVRPGPGNQAPVLNLAMADGNGTTARFTFSLAGLPADRFTTVYAIDGATLAAPNAVENEKNPGNLKLDPATIKQWQIQGGWTGKPLEVALKGVYLANEVPPEVTDARNKAQALQREQAEQARKAAQTKQDRLQELLANCPHPADGAQVINVAPVASDLLAIEMQSREFKYGSFDPYSPQPDDKLTGGEKAWVIRDGKPVEEMVGKTIERKGADGKLTPLGTISFDGKWVLRPEHVVGTELETLAMEMPQAYAISSTDDPAYSAPAAPVKVYRKSKPNSPKDGEGKLAVLHHVYLQLPHALKEGAHYQVQFRALNTRDSSAAYLHDPRSVRSEAIHASHVGYDPAAPFKRAYLSIWLGTGGGYQPAEAPAFELIDARTGKSAFAGKAQLAKAKGAPEQLKEEKDYAQTAVYWLDFGSFKTPGEYKVFVPGIGTSYPFRIAPEVWKAPFTLSLKGILAQRSGIELGPPFLDFKRPRPYHPDDGVKFYAIDIGVDAGQEGGRGERMLKLWQQNGKLEEVKGIWGGYQDAGDWDAYTTSLITARLLTEAFEVSPEYATTLKLTLPAGESANKIPDLLDEALWGLTYFKRLQVPEGGVRDGYGDGWGCRPGDVSWNDSNPVLVYAPQVSTSYLYAAAAAKMARVLAPYDPAMAADFRQSAIKAWRWADAQSAPTPKADVKARYGEDAARASAAVELYWLTRDQAFHEAFKKVTELKDAVSTEYAGGWVEPMKQNDATFAYARLPDELADRTLKANAIKHFELAGNIGVYFMQHNAFNIVTAYPGIPCSDFLGYFTAPGGIINVDIVRAHKITGDPRHLAAVVASTNSSLGANPDNMAMTTGLGPNPVRFPLKLDSLRTGQPAPVGLTVYGAGDQSNPGAQWVHTWLIGNTTVPNSRTWPAQESYYDVFGWPGCNEFTVDRPVALAAYTWCYLGAVAAGK